MSLFRYNFYDGSKGYPLSGLSFYRNGMPPEELKYHVLGPKLWKKKNNISVQNIQEYLDRNIYSWTRHPQCLYKVENALSILVKICMNECDAPTEKNVKGGRDFLDHTSNKLVVKTLASFAYSFVLCSPQLEFGFPHTNSIYIFFSTEFIETSEPLILAKTILHEMTHIYQRYSKDDNVLSILSHALGYRPFMWNINVLGFGRKTEKDYVMISNPDTFSHKQYIYKQAGDHYFFRLALDVQRQTFLRICFKLEKMGKYSQVQGTYVDFIPNTVAISRQYEHPYEVIACFWADLVFRAAEKNYTI